MSLRVDEIALPTRAPLDGYVLRELESVDLVVITGPNGAGKSTLLRPLSGKAKSSDGVVTCIDPLGTRTMFTARGKGIEQSITFVESAELMAKFRNLKEPLALAANVTREAHVEALLEQLSGLLSKEETRSDQGEPEEIRLHRRDFIAADRRCGQVPRTIRQYERIGQELAARAGVAWTTLQPLPEDSRRDAESALRPEPRALDGLAEVRLAMKPIVDLQDPGTGLSSTLAARQEAEAGLASAIRSAEGELGERASARPGDTLVEHAQFLRGALAAAQADIRRAIEAKGRLEECRRIALEWLSDPAVEEHEQSQCPVCEQRIRPGAMQRELRLKTANTDPEKARWLQRLNRFDELDRELDFLSSRYRSASEHVRRDHAEAAAHVQSAAQHLRPASGWAKSVRAAAETLHRQCARWLDAHRGGLTESAIEDLRALWSNAFARSQELSQEERTLNDGLRDAEDRFRQLQALGSVLALRAQLDAAPWNVSLSEVDAARRRSEQRDAWLAVLQEMSDELRQRQRAASVVDDSGVQARFRRLIERLARTQPVLESTQFRGDRLASGNVDCSERLSEGQRVLVNIAAVVAVVGKVAGVPAHLPGWIAFDEPTNGLDEASRDAVADYLGSVTVADLPSQMFITSFERSFAERLASEAARNGRRVRLVELPPFVPGRPGRPIEREVR